MHEEKIMDSERNEAALHGADYSFIITHLQLYCLAFKEITGWPR